LKLIEIDKDKLRMKISALNVDSDAPSLDFLGSRKPAHEGIKLLFYHCWPVFSENGRRSPLATSFSVVSTSMTMKDPELPKKGLYWFLQYSTAAHTSRMNYDEMAGDKLTVYEQELL